MRSHRGKAGGRRGRRPAARAGPGRRWLALRWRLGRRGRRLLLGAELLALAALVLFLRSGGRGQEGFGPFKGTIDGLVPALAAWLAVALLWAAAGGRWAWRWERTLGWLGLFGATVLGLHLSAWASGAPSGGDLYDTLGPLGTLLVLLALALGTWPLSVSLTPGRARRLVRLSAWLLGILGRLLRLFVRAGLLALRRAVGAVRALARALAVARRRWTLKLREARRPLAPALVPAGPPAMGPGLGAELGTANPSFPATSTPAAAPLRPQVAVGRWQLPPLDLLEPPGENGVSQGYTREQTENLARLIERTLGDFGVPVKVADVRLGPTVTQFGLEPGYRERRDRQGNLVRREKVKVRDITARANDLCLALARTIRIEAPVPGRPVVGIEVPNARAALVSLRALLSSEAFRRLKERARLPLALGEHLSKEAVAADLARMPHLLIAGATGSGKSVCINAVISTLLMRHTPATLRLLLIDPKRVELSAFKDLPHLLSPVVAEVDKAITALNQVLREMEARFRLLAQAEVRNIEGYNRLSTQAPLPYIVVIIDELADLMMLAPDEVERAVCRLAQLARATGIHLVVATQRPSVDVVTGLIKANFPSRISFMVTSYVDSRTILDMGGAEKLLGQGDMLYMPTDAAKPLRLQGTYVSDDEIQSLVRFWAVQGQPQYAPEFENLPAWSPGQGPGEDDELYDEAADLAQRMMVQGKELSVSYLQRQLRIGYNRAARLKERLEAEGLPGATDEEGRERSPETLE